MAKPGEIHEIFKSVLYGFATHFRLRHADKREVKAISKQVRRPHLPISFRLNSSDNAVGSVVGMHTKFKVVDPGVTRIFRYPEILRANIERFDKIGVLLSGGVGDVNII